MLIIKGILKKQFCCSKLLIYYKIIIFYSLSSDAIKHFKYMSKFMKVFGASASGALVLDSEGCFGRSTDAFRPDALTKLLECNLVLLFDRGVFIRISGSSNGSTKRYTYFAQSREEFVVDGLDGLEGADDALLGGGLALVVAGAQSLELRVQSGFRFRPQFADLPVVARDNFADDVLDARDFLAQKSSILESEGVGLEEVEETSLDALQDLSTDFSHGLLVHLRVKSFS